MGMVKCGKAMKQNLLNVLDISLLGRAQKSVWELQLAGLSGQPPNFWLLSHVANSSTGKKTVG